MSNEKRFIREFTLLLDVNLNDLDSEGIDLSEFFNFDKKSMDCILTQAPKDLMASIQSQEDYFNPLKSFIEFMKKTQFEDGELAYLVYLGYLTKFNKIKHDFSGLNDDTNKNDLRRIIDDMLDDLLNK